MVQERPEGKLKVLYTIARYFAALAILFYGFAKLNGSQFTILGSELDKPMGQVSGFWLTWYYFGYSRIYGDLIAWAQILGGVLLMFRKTTLLGACLLLPILGNIILIDIFYGVAALPAAFLITAALVGILAAHRRELLELFWTRQNSLFPQERAGVALGAVKWAVRALVVILPALFTWWIANYNNRNPTPLDGEWKVVTATPQPGQEASLPQVIFFEFNRAGLCVFKYGDGRYENHYFEVDSQAHRVQISGSRSPTSPQIFSGHYELAGPRLALHGKLADQPGQVELILEKVPGDPRAWKATGWFAPAPSSS